MALAAGSMQFQPHGPARRTRRASSYYAPAELAVADPAWTGNDDTTDSSIDVGEKVFMLNPYFREGTQLRKYPLLDSEYLKCQIFNDTRVEVLQISEGFARIRTCDPDVMDEAEGWVRLRNLARERRGKGMRAHQSLNPWAKPRGGTISGLVPVSPDELQREGTREKTENAQVEQLMAMNGVKASSKTDAAEMEVIKQALQRQSTRFRKQIARHRKLALDPHSPVLRRWDTVTALALIFTATVTPFEVCVLSPMSFTQMLTDPLSWINRGRTHERLEPPPITVRGR
jgi:hypothetical protein